MFQKNIRWRGRSKTVVLLLFQNVKKLEVQTF